MLRTGINRSGKDGRDRYNLLPATTWFRCSDDYRSANEVAVMGSVGHSKAYWWWWRWHAANKRLRERRESHYLVNKSSCREWVTIPVWKNSR